MSGQGRRAWSGGLWIAILLTGFSLSAWTAAPAAADEEEGELRGLLTVDVGAGTVTVDGTVLLVTGDTRLKLNDANVALDVLGAYVTANPDTQAEAEYRVEAGQKVARKVEVEDDGGGGDDDDEMELKGALLADPANNMVSVGGIPLLVDANTDIEAGDEHVTLAELADYLAANPGTWGEAHYMIVGADRVATQVETKGSNQDDGDDDDDDEQEVRGVLTADVAAKTASIGGVAYIVSIGTEIKVLGNRATLAGLAAYLEANPGAIGKIEYRVVEGQLVAREVKVIAPPGTPAPVGAEVTGQILAIDVATGAIQFRTDGGVDLTLTAEPGTEIQVDSANVTLADLAALVTPEAGVQARVHYDPDTLIVREISATIPVVQEQAQITSLNPRTGDVTVRVPTLAARPELSVKKMRTLSSFSVRTLVSKASSVTLSSPFSFMVMPISARALNPLVEVVPITLLARSLYVDDAAESASSGPAWFVFWSYLRASLKNLFRSL